jgi:signal transduction histidine kinase
MRDPLSRVPVRYKLPLAFALLGLAAFALAGYLVTVKARQGLEREVWQRLEDRGARAALVVGEALNLLEQRAKDFASDGYLRLELDRLRTSGGGAGAPAEQLVRHLRTNKLPLDPALADAYILDPEGAWVLGTLPSPIPPQDKLGRDDFGFGPLTAPRPGQAYSTFTVSTPITSIDDTGRLGYLQLVLRTDVWARRLRQALAWAPEEGFQITLRTPDGSLLPLFADPADAGEGPTEHPAVIQPIGETGWQVGLSGVGSAVSSPVGLVTTFALLSLGLVTLTLALMVPANQFLLKPLAELEAAAAKISRGDFSARVAHRSGDEVGHLAEAFNVMADAVEGRTEGLARRTEELRQEEAESRFERDRLQAVIHSLQDGLFIIDRQGLVTLANEAAEALLPALSQGRCGVSQDQCTRQGRLPQHCFACLADYRLPPTNCELAIGDRIFDLKVTSLRDPGGRAVEAGRVFLSRDVSEKHRQAAQQAHHERLSVLGEIAAVMAHEMNNPLAAISMFSQMLLDDLDPDSPLHTHAAVVHRNTLHCKRTIRSLLDMAVTTAPERRGLDVRDLVEDVVELLQPVAHQDKTVLRIDVQAEEGRVYASEIQLRQALVNLILNAIHATAGTGGGEVTVGTLRRGGEVVLRVHDNGPGIPNDLQERIFEPFFTTKAAGQGTGLGLPTTRRIVEAHQGCLVLRSSNGEGTTFEILLPGLPWAAADKGDETVLESAS